MIEEQNRMSYFWYIIIFSLTIILANFCRNRERKKYWIACGNLKIYKINLCIMDAIVIGCPCILFLALRYGVGSDFFNYQSVYDYFLAGNDYYQTEAGYNFIMGVADSIYSDYRSVIVLTSIITVWLMMLWIIKVNQYFQLELMAFIILTIYIGGWSNTIKQSIAVGIVALSYLQIEKRNLGKFLILIFIASTVHISSIMVIPLYFIYGNEDKKFAKSSSGKKRFMKFIFLVGICFVIYIFYYIYAVQNNLLFSRYIYSTYEGGRTKDFFFISVLLYIPELIFMPKVIKESEKITFYYILIGFEAVFFLASFKIAYAFRMASFFSLGHAIVIPSIIDYVDKKYKKLIVFYFVIILIIYSIYMRIINSYDHLLPYISIFSI